MAWRELSEKWRGNPKLERMIFFMLCWQFAVNKMIEA
jgi:hypothetical protein